MMSANDCDKTTALLAGASAETSGSHAGRGFYVSKAVVTVLLRNATTVAVVVDASRTRPCRQHGAPAAWRFRGRFGEARAACETPMEDLPGRSPTLLSRRGGREYLSDCRAVSLKGGEFYVTAGFELAHNGRGRSHAGRNKRLAEAASLALGDEGAGE